MLVRSTAQSTSASGSAGARETDTNLRTTLAPWIVAAITLALGLQLYLVFARQINWDEFYFLARIYDYRRGTPMAPLQTFYVHFFTWLRFVSITSIDEIIFARGLMLCLEVGSCGFIYYVARRFASREASLLAIIVYASCGYVLIHGAAFRADPIATFFLMASVALLLVPRPSWRHALVGAASVAIAGLVTIKAVFYFPVIIAIAALRIAEARERRSLLLIFGFGIVLCAAIFAAFFAAHRASIVVSPHAGAVKGAVNDFHVVFGAGNFWNTWHYLANAVVLSPTLFAAIFLGLKQCIWSGFHQPMSARLRVWCPLVFAFPVATLLFYRNSFPYYYPFVLAPAAVLAAIAFDQFSRFWEKALWAAISVVLLLAQFWSALEAGQAAQRATLAAVHVMFPKPVPYIDRCGMVSSYQKVGFFMSTWGLEGYRARGRPVLREAILHSGPRFVIANSPVLKEALVPGSYDIPARYRLLAADTQALRKNYVHEWGDVWVAGKSLDHLGTEQNRSVSMDIAGPYTIESSAPLIVDGTVRQPGAVVRLSQGTHVFRSVMGPQNVVLRWGDHLPYPRVSAPDGPIFKGF